MSSPTVYCVVTSKKLTFLNSFAEVIDFFEKSSKEDNDYLEVYKWQATGGYAYYLTLSK